MIAHDSLLYSNQESGAIYSQSGLIYRILTILSIILFRIDRRLFMYYNIIFWGIKMLSITNFQDAFKEKVKHNVLMNFL